MQMRINRWITLDRCVACGSALGHSDRAMEVADPFKISDERFTVVRCGECQTWLLNPRPAPEEMGQFYEDGFLYAPPSDARPSLLSRLAGHVQALNLASEVNWVCRHLPKKGRYLDVSAGNGQILAAVSGRRPDAELHATEYAEGFRRTI